MPNDQPSAEATPPPIAEIEIPREGRKVPFQDLEQFRAWIESELKCWDWLRSLAGQDGLGPVAASVDQLGAARDQIAAAQSAPAESQQRVQNIANAINALRVHYSDRGLPAFDSPAAAFLNVLFRENPLTAGHALWYLTGRERTSQSGPSSQGIIRAELFRLGLAATDTATAEALRKLAAEFTTAVGDARATHAALQRDAKDALERLAGDHREWGDRHVAAEQERSVRFDAQLDKARTDLENLKKALESHLALRGAVTYWTRKANAHRWQALIWAALALGTALGIAFGGWHALQTIVLTRPKEDPHLPWLAGYSVLAITLAMWLLRVLVRLTLSNVHLATDGRIRATMMTTYLALLRRGQGELDAKDRRLILEVLFRPSVTGIVKDDAAPPGLWEFLSRKAGGGG
jgi:hypothetical protein